MGMIPRDIIGLSLAPRFSEVICAFALIKPFQRFLRANRKPFKRLARCVVASTRLKPGANERGQS
jgi:hypothetical protein